jgi:hypothetical protein
MNDSFHEPSGHHKPESLGNMSSSSVGAAGNLDKPSKMEARKSAVVSSLKDSSQKAQQQQQQQPAASDSINVTARARRRREDAVRRLVADVQARPDRKLATTVAANGGSQSETGSGAPSPFDPTDNSTKESQDWIIASTVAVALERGLDRDLHHELVQEAKENAGRIGQVCHDHSDVFLASVGKVVALGGPSGDLASKLAASQEELETKTAGPMQEAAMLWEEATESHARARALQIMVQEFEKVSVYLEKARKQAALGRPRGALEAVDDARNVLTAPVSSLYVNGGAQMERAAKIVKEAAKKKAELESSEEGGANGGSHHNRSIGGGDDGAANGGVNGTTKGMITLEETPFGRRASLMLPKIENEVLMGARRGLNRWFLSLRSGGDGAKAGRAVLRRSAHSMAVGPGNLGLGGHMPPSYLWRAKVCDNLISRMNQNGRVVRSVRNGYWFERDAPKDAARLEACVPGMERRSEGGFYKAIEWRDRNDWNRSWIVEAIVCVVIRQPRSSHTVFCLLASRSLCVRLWMVPLLGREHCASGRSQRLCNGSRRHGQGPVRQPSRWPREQPPRQGPVPGIPGQGQGSHRQRHLRPHAVRWYQQEQGRRRQEQVGGPPDAADSL